MPETLFPEMAPYVSMLCGELLRPGNIHNLYGCHFSANCLRVRRYHGGHCSVKEHRPGMHKALDLILSKEDKKENSYFKDSFCSLLHSVCPSY